MINKETEELIKSFEGFRSQAYRCSAGKLTIAWGHTEGVKEGDVIGIDQAEELFRKDIKKFEDCVNKNVKVDLTDNQFGALVSLCYNIGCSAFKSSTLLRLLNKGYYEQVPPQFMRWKYINGVESAGLHRRRVAEVNLWRKEDEEST